jgi:hypothetical protein
MKTTRTPYLQPAFLVCAMLLLTAATTKSLVIRFLGWQLTKYPIELKQPLHEMDEKALLPYVVRNKAKIDNPDVLATLGTEAYLQWILENPDAEPGSPTRYCSVFITYYTGDPDRVPHVPDECYVGGGNVRKAGYVDSAPLARDGEQAPQIIRYQNILFGSAGDAVLMSGADFYVAYLFHANGQYSGSRTETRTILSQNFLSKYSYFSKVEWQFYGADPFGRVYPSRQQVVQASERLLQVLLPAIEKGHWPDWDAANRD